MTRSPSSRSSAGWGASTSPPPRPLPCSSYAGAIGRGRDERAPAGPPGRAGDAVRPGKGQVQVVQQASSPRPVDVAPTFAIARNPEPGSKLPYLLRLPLQGGPLLLKAGATWPRTAKVYCHPAESWPASPDIVEEVPVRVCRRLGVAIDLVLDRARESRSQLVFTTLHDGRPAIFWQSPRTTARARPGVRIPARRASGQPELHVLVDTRANATRTDLPARKRQRPGRHCRRATTVSPSQAKLSPWWNEKAWLTSSPSWSTEAWRTPWPNWRRSLGPPSS